MFVISLIATPPSAFLAWMSADYTSRLANASNGHSRGHRYASHGKRNCRENIERSTIQNRSKNADVSPTLPGQDGVSDFGGIIVRILAAKPLPTSARADCC